MPVNVKPATAKVDGQLTPSLFLLRTLGSDNMPVAVDTGQELGMLRDQVKRLKARAEQLRAHDLELISAQRQVAEGKALVQKTKETWDHKLSREQFEFSQKQQEDAERIARYEKKAADDALRIASLEREIAALKKAVAQSESLPDLLARLKLSSYLKTLEEEELDVKLLRSMGEQVLKSNMADLGMTDAEAARLSGALFAVDVS